MNAPDAGGEVEIVQEGVAQETLISEPAAKTRKEGCVRTIFLTCGVIFLLLTGVFCVGGAAVIAQDTSGESIVPFTCMGIFSLVSGALLILASRRLGKESGPEKKAEELIRADSEKWEKALHAGDFETMQKMGTLLDVASELTAFRTKILGFSKQYPMRSMMGGAGVVKAEKQIPWIDRTLKEAADALITEKDPFGNPITSIQTKNGLVQLINIVCDPEYLSFMDMIYEGIADPLKSSMQELEQIIERISTGDGSGPEKRTAEPIPASSVNGSDILQKELALLQAEEKLMALRKQSPIGLIDMDLIILAMEISGFSQKYPMRGMKGGPGVAKAEKQIPWIDRTLKEAADALKTGKDPFGNPITMTQTKNGLVQLINIVCDPEYLTFMDMIYDGIADPLKNSMHELEQIIERIPTSVESGTEKGTVDPVSVTSEEVKELFQDGLDLFKEGKYREAIPILEEVTGIDPTFAPAQFTLGGAYSRVAGEYRDEETVRPWANNSAEAFRKAIDLASRYGGLNERQLTIAQDGVETLDLAETAYQIKREAASLPEDQRRQIYSDFMKTQNSEFLQGIDIQDFEELSRKGNLALMAQSLERDGVEADDAAMTKITAKYRIRSELLAAIYLEGKEKKWPWKDS